MNRIATAAPRQNLGLKLGFQVFLTPLVDRRALRNRRKFVQTEIEDSFIKKIRQHYVRERLCRVVLILILLPQDSDRWIEIAVFCRCRLDNHTSAQPQSAKLLCGERGSPSCSYRTLSERNDTRSSTEADKDCAEQLLHKQSHSRPASGYCPRSVRLVRVGRCHTRLDDLGAEGIRVAH